MPARPCFRPLIPFLLLPLATAAPAFAQQSRGESGRVPLFASDSLDLQNRVALSPDGRWLAFSAMETPGTASLWIKPVGGGAPTRLTSSGRWDQDPVWSPAGDRLFFVSNRPARAGDQSSYGMVLPIDPASGRAAGVPRQVTADPVRGGVHPSPDGTLLAYMDGRDPGELKVLPATGGASRRVASLSPRSGNVTWSSDGSDIIFATNFLPSEQRVVSRVPASGGEPVVLARLDVPRGWIVIGPDGERIAVEQNGDGPRERSIQIVDRKGTVLQTIATTRNTRTSGFTPDGRSLIAVESNVVAPTRLMALAGGAYREITPPASYDWVLGFTPDGSAVYTWTEEKGKAVVARVALQGGARKVFPESPGARIEGGNDRYLFQVSPRDGAAPRTLVAMDLADGERHTLSEALPGTNQILAFGPGGEWAAQEEIFFFEREGDRLHVKGWSGPGKARTLRTLPASVLDRSNVAVHGSRVAWQQSRGDSMDILIADGPGSPPRRLLSMLFTAMGGNEIAFSRDGSHLALHYSTGPGSPDLMAIVDASGRAAPRIIDTGLRYWYWPRWNPDNSGVLVIGGGAGAEAHVVLIPVREGERPVNLTRDDPSSKWGFEISPDGRYIAYPGEIWKGSTVWKIDLGGESVATRPQRP